MTVRRHRPTARKQHGLSLITSLLFMVAALILGVSVMSINVMQERMIGNTKDRELAMQAAEAALRDAERDIEANLDATSAFVEGCAGGLCIPPSDTASGPTSAPLWQTIDWASKSRAYGSRTAAPALLGPANTALATQPRYFIERLPTLPPRSGEDACVGGGCSNVAVDRARAYRITVRASGVRSATEVMLQSVYVKQ